MNKVQRVQVAYVDDMVIAGTRRADCEKVLKFVNRSFQVITLAN